MGFLNFNLINILLSLPAVVIAFVAQGYAKALVADRLGDKTPRFHGRVTLNPAAHLDPIGFLMILLIGFGWTKPVETNPRAYKRGQKDAIKVAVAAPIANFIVGFVAIIINTIAMRLLSGIVPLSVYSTLVGMLLSIATVNISLGVFTLIPLPGLSGFDIFKALSPKKFYEVADTLYQYQMIIIFAIILVGGSIISTIAGFIFGIFQTIAGTLLFFL